MKIHKAFALGLVVISASSAVAQSPADRPASQPVYFSRAASIETANLEAVAKAYQRSLASGNPGVVESALAHVTHLRIMAPDQNLADIETFLMVLARDGATYPIRSKAYLAMHVFANPAAFRELADRSFDEPDDLFDAVAARLQPAL